MLGRPGGGLGFQPTTTDEPTIQAESPALAEERMRAAMQAEGSFDAIPTVERPAIDPKFHDSVTIERPALVDSLAETQRNDPAAPANQPAGKPAGKQQNDDLEDRRTGAWAAQGEVNLRQSSPTGQVGPTGGLAKGVPTEDVAFGANKIKPIKGEFEDGRFVPTDRGGDDDWEPARSSRVGLWIAIISVVVIAGGAAAVYMVMTGKKGGEQAATIASDAAAIVEAAPADATPKEAPPDVKPTAEAILAKAVVELRGDTVAGLELALAEVDGIGEPDAAALVAGSRLRAALAQHSLDQASASTDPSQQKELQKDARRRGAKARDLADKALKLEKNMPAALVARADAQRILGRSRSEVDRMLSRAIKAADDDNEALYVRALLRERDNRPREARKELEKILSTQAGDVRATYRMALLDFEDKNYDEAKKGAEAVIAAESEHAGAKSLVERVAAATAVVTSDPLPPEDSGNNSGNDSGKTGAGGIDSYDRLLAKADKLAESGRCSQATSVYGKALDVNPSGVAALTGLGYCHVDARNFHSAQAKFRAALGISPRYQDALWGVAEAYQQQGLKQQAIASYKKFAAEHPGSKRAERAKRQIENLGGSVVDKPEGGDTPKPGGDEPKPGGDEPKPGGGDEPKPGGDEPKPGGDTPKPGGDTPKPGGDTPKPGGDTPPSDPPPKPPDPAPAPDPSE
jgi:tetratricopeptide (TPR) repeat protein